VSRPWCLAAAKLSARRVAGCEPRVSLGVPVAVRDERGHRVDAEAKIRPAESKKSAAQRPLRSALVVRTRRAVLGSSSSDPDNSFSAHSRHRYSGSGIALRHSIAMEGNAPDATTTLLASPAEHAANANDVRIG